MNLVAKPIIDNEFWVITDENGKVGNVESSESGFKLKIADNVSYFDSTFAISEAVQIKFETAQSAISSITPAYAQWPYTNPGYNHIWDVKRKLHVYTKSHDSKCYYVAGYFRMKLDDQWQTIFCPKYIFIQRYPYLGPFASEKLADAASVE